MIPADINLPPKFAEFRPGQLDSIIDLVASERRFTLLPAPVGAGKSLVYEAAQQILGARTLILVGTKGLQHQLMGDFASIGMVDMRGASNYRCIAVDDGGELAAYGNAGTGCDQGPCHAQVKCELFHGGCLYYDAQRAARGAQIVVTNYAYWMALGRYANPNAIGAFDMLVLDEAHAAHDLLAAFCTVGLSKAEIRELLDMALPPIDEGVAVWAEWARGAVGIAQAAHKQAERELEFGDRRAATTTLLRLGHLERDLGELAKADTWKRAEGGVTEVHMPGETTDWVAERTKRGAKFSPVWAHGYAEKYLFRGIPRVVLASATLTATDALYLGIGPEDSHYVDVGAGFDPERRPFIYVRGMPEIRVDRHLSEGGKRVLVNRMDRVIGARLDRKGIIHSRSYARAREIRERSKYSEHMIVPSSGKWTRQAVEKFKRAEPPCVLVSPAIEEGFDFIGDECRWQIIAKVPFIDQRSPVIVARQKSDGGYVNYVAARDLVQMYGRSTRADDDWSEVFIFDAHWQWFKSKPLFPGWFEQAWVWAETVPEPLAV